MSISENIYFIAIILDFNINIVYSEHELFSFCPFLYFESIFFFLFKSGKSEMFLFEKVIYKRFESKAYVEKIIF